FGMECPRTLMIDPAMRVASQFSQSGRATGVVIHLERLLDVLRERRAEYDAVAISTRVDIDADLRHAYYESRGTVVNPWGGVEAIFTHALSSLLDVPTAHSPMFESMAVAKEDLGITDPRMAAEAISTGFLMCVLKGLQRSPRIVADAQAMREPGVMTAADVSCLVIPDGCLGLPTLAALKQGIPVIAVRENENILRNRLADLPWASGQLY